MSGTFSEDPLSINDLPPAGAELDTPEKKLSVVNGIKRGVLSRRAAAARYNQPEAEFERMQSALRLKGKEGLGAKNGADGK
jgi:hypothetical protein